MSRIRLDSLYRYHVPREHLDDFMERTDDVLREVADDFQTEVESALQSFLEKLQAELGRPVFLSSEARFWMLDNIALLRSAHSSPAARTQAEQELLQETIFLLEGS